MKLQFSRKKFEKYSNLKFGNPVGVELLHADGRQMDTTKLIFAFRNFADASKNDIWIRVTWNMTPSGSARVSRRLEGAWDLHLQPSWTPSPTTRTQRSFETSEAVHPAAQLHTAAEKNPLQEHCPNFKTGYQNDITCVWYGDERNAFKYSPRICLQERAEPLDITHCSHFHDINRPSDLPTHQQYKYG